MNGSIYDDGFDKGLMDLYFWKFKTYLSSVGKYLLDTNWKCMKNHITEITNDSERSNLCDR